MVWETEPALSAVCSAFRLIFAVAAFWRPGFVREVMADLQRSALTRLLFAFISLTVGLSIVLSHNLCVADWRLAITLIGGGGIIKGFLAIAWMLSFVGFIAASMVLMDQSRGHYWPARLALLLSLMFVFGLVGFVLIYS